MSTTVSVKYGIRLKSTGEILGVEVSDNSGRYACGSQTHRLTKKDGWGDHPPWLTDDPQNVADTLFCDAKWYNSDEKTPCWGGIDRADMEPVRVTVTTAVEPVDIEVPYNVDSIDTCDISREDAAGYVGRELSGPYRYVMILANESLEVMKAHEGRMVGQDNRHNKRELLAALPVPAAVGDRDRVYTDPRRGYCMLICRMPR